jgi:hypothetical protein
MAQSTAAVKRKKSPISSALLQPTEFGHYEKAFTMRHFKTGEN